MSIMYLALGGSPTTERLNPLNAEDVWMAAAVPHVSLATMHQVSSLPCGCRIRTTCCMDARRADYSERKRVRRAEPERPTAADAAVA